MRWLRKFTWLFTAKGRAEVVALFYALRNPRATLAARGIALLALVYVVWPFDVVPDVVPLLGWLDDLAIGPLLMWAASKFIPVDVMASARDAVRRKRSRTVG
jgi:uncharacterized membrane protein YkvA (DUF1232 family)